MASNVQSIDDARTDDNVPQGKYHIEATESLVERTLRSLKHNDLFAVFDQQGNCNGGADGPDGLFYKDTRFLSKLVLGLGGVVPLQLGSVLLDDNGAMVVDLTNADLRSKSGRIWLQRDTVHLSRFKFLESDTAFERLRLRAYNPIGQPVPLELNFDADFADLFEVRGQHRAERGQRTVRVIGKDRVEFSYLGLDNVRRRTTMLFEPAPDVIGENGARWEIDLDERPERSVVVKTNCAIDGEHRDCPPIAQAFRASRGGHSRVVRQRTHLRSSNPQFNAIISRAWSDLDMLVTETPQGPYPYAGVPWYSTIFGRDGIITAMQTLWCAPGLSKGVLKTLAALQATEVDPVADAEPGKILHEMRGGEMSALGEVPFQRYYGTVDATPLFVMLAGRYARRTGDLDTIRSIWPNIRAALKWMDDYGDLDGDGLIEYARQNDKGLTNQGWKDSADSVFHKDGRLAHGPIALCEVQGYAFAARQGAADIAEALGETAFADEQREKAEQLRTLFEQLFWLEDEQFYAMALDGEKRPCRVLSSNAGHCLFAGIAAPDRARKVGKTLLSSRFFSGWGVRTIAAGEARFNPMSYHNGSVWPHDNSMIALGLSRYGLKKEVATLLGGMFDAAIYDDLRRLPELFCGFSRRRRCAPTSYPVACSPQAWAAATPFALIEAALGLDIDHASASLGMDRPVLPTLLDDLAISNLSVGDATLALGVARTRDDVTTAVTDRKGEATVSITK